MPILEIWCFGHSSARHRLLPAGGGQLLEDNARILVTQFHVHSHTQASCQSVGGFPGRQVRRHDTMKAPGCARGWMKAPSQFQAVPRFVKQTCVIIPALVRAFFPHGVTPRSP